MASFIKKCVFTLEYKEFFYSYNTAYELGKLVKESGSNMPNPFDPDCTDFDDFNQGVSDER